MIGEAIQKKLAAVIPNAYNEIGDEGIKAPFCTHSEKESVRRNKEGISGYEYTVEILIANKTADLVKAQSVLVIAAIESLQNTTDEGTVIKGVTYEGDDAGFDRESRLYGNLITFTIETSNR